MSLAPEQFARREGSTTHLRPDALRLSWTIDDLLTSDKHVLHVRFTCSAKIADTDADQRMFREVFLGTSPVATMSDVVNHFSAPLRSAAALSAQQHPAEQWLGPRQPQMQTALTNAAKPIAFACGLEVLPPFHVEVSSPSLERANIESMQRARAEERVAGQVQHLQRATELLKQFHALRDQMPQLSPGQVLQQMNPVDRGSTLQSLLMASAKEAPQQQLYAVAGPYLVRIDAHQSPPKTSLIALPTTVGPLRSVQPAVINGLRMLLIGARGGVMVIPPDSPAEAQVYLDPSVQSQLGFNRVVARGDEIWASHGEAGVVGWKLMKTAEPFARFNMGFDVPIESSPPEVAPTLPWSSVGSPSLMTAGSRSARPSGPRNLQVLNDERLVYSIGAELMILDGSSDPRPLPSASKAEIVAILPSDAHTMLVVHADSAIAVLSRPSGQIVDQQRRAGRVIAAGALPWLGSVRMLLVDTDGPIDCVGFDDPLITQYLSPHRSLRVVTASPDLVAALSTDRQRVILWSSWDGRAPLAEVHVTALARHRVADVEFG